jgi:hypothetical protein
MVFKPEKKGQKKQENKENVDINKFGEGNSSNVMK